jgi:lipoprotein-anchoring transpeptidase ErfK/SrfK
MGRLKQRLSGLKLPALKLPALKLPDWKLPGWKLPGWKLPGWKLPGWKLPGWGPAAGLAGWQRIAVVVGLAVLLLGAGSVAATAKVGATSGRVLAGIQISGIDVGGMTRDQAIAAVESAAVTPKLQRRVVVVGGGKRWPVTPAGLGRDAGVDEAVDQALAGPDLSWASDFWHRLTSRPVRHAVEVRYSDDERRVGRFVRSLAPKLAVTPTDASIELVDGEVVRQKAKKGRALDVAASTRALAAALRGGSRTVKLVTRPVAPKVTEDKLGKTIEVNLATNKLSFYDGLKVVKVYPVATGQPSFPTPTGSWQVVNKRVNPTWNNPDPEGWGKGMPLSIPPGPGNPLGTRAISLDASGINIHGTYASGSIGSYASHGCIRMFLSDVEALFPQVPMGTPVLIHR